MSVSPVMPQRDVWFCIPTAQPAKCGDAFARWRARGYRTAALVDPGADAPANADAVVRADRYAGYAASVNRLVREVALPAGAVVVVTGGDDFLPIETHTADELAAEFVAHFGGTFGVMDPSGHDLNGRTAAAGPWMGREWCERVNGGTGPLHEGYYHFFDDAEQKAVAERLGAYWPRPDLYQRHEHWTLTGEPRPPHLTEAAARWAASSALFRSRAAAGFPGHEPLPVEAVG